MTSPDGFVRPSLRRSLGPSFAVSCSARSLLADEIESSCCSGRQRFPGEQCVLWSNTKLSITHFASKKMLENYSAFASNLEGELKWSSICSKMFRFTMGNFIWLWTNAFEFFYVFYFVVRCLRKQTKTPALVFCKFSQQFLSLIGCDNRCQDDVCTMLTTVGRKHRRSSSILWQCGCSKRCRGRLRITCAVKDWSN